MALEALYPLKKTIGRLLNSPRIIPIESPSREILESAHHAVKSAAQLAEALEEFRDQIGRKKIERLEAEIAESARALEDALDSHFSDQILTQSETETESIPLLLCMEGVRGDIDGFKQKMKQMQRLFNPWFKEEEDSDVFGLSNQSRVTRSMFMSWCATKAASIFLGMKEDYIQDLEKLLPYEDDDDDYAVLLTGDFYGTRFGLMSWWMNKAASAFHMEKKEDGLPLLEEEKEHDKNADTVSSKTESAVNMVGVTGLFCEVRNELIEDTYWLTFVCLLGMAGIGKTALAKKIINDPLILSMFDGCIFVRMGPEYQIEQLMQAMLAQLRPNDDKMPLDEEKLRQYLRKTFGIRKYLIVLDDVWNQNLYHELQRILPLGSSVLITTRIKEVSSNIHFHSMPFLNKEESWNLLRGMIFSEEKCPRELEKAGKKIAENCEGLPLLIVTVANLLSEAEKTLEFWNLVAANKTNSIFITAYEEILEVLYPSYNYLPQSLKTCFRYMGAFPQNSEVRISKLINLWSAEGFVDTSYKCLRGILEGYFDELISNHNIALDQLNKTIFTSNTCSLHSVFWYLSKRVAWDEKFLLVLNSYADAMVEETEKRRRISVYKNSIFSIKDVHGAIGSTSSSVRSLLCSRNLPPSISKLWNLQCLILHPHLSIKSSVSESYVPVEIWDLQELEFLQIMGRNLPDSPPGAVLTNLLTLLDVGPQTCTKRIVQSIPNLEKLRVRIEMMPNTTEALRFHDRMSHLTLLQCVVVNPYYKLMPQAIIYPTAFPSLLKLNLSGFGYPWEDMNKLAELPQLQLLTLKCFAFREEKWEVHGGGFKKLLHLSIEDTDLVTWSSGYDSFTELCGLSIKNCYKLQEIPHMPYLEEILIVDCNPSAETYARQILPNYCTFHVQYSWLTDE